jgi:hypothetical protein
MARHVWSKAAAFVAVVTAGLLLAQPIAASSPQPASGTATVVTTTFTAPPRLADGNVILEATQTGVVTGTFSGTFVENVRLVQHPSGLTTFEGTATLTGTADGCGTGTIPFHLEGQGEGGVFEGKFVTIDHSASTVPVHAVLPFVQIGAGAGSTLTYSGTYHCD